MKSSGRTPAFLFHFAKIADRRSLTPESAAAIDHRFLCLSLSSIVPSSTSPLSFLLLPEVLGSFSFSLAGIPPPTSKEDHAEQLLAAVRIMRRHRVPFLFSRSDLSSQRSGIPPEDPRDDGRNRENRCKRSPPKPSFLVSTIPLTIFLLVSCNRNRWC